MTPTPVHSDKVRAPTHAELRRMIEDAYVNVDGLIDAYSHIKDDDFIRDQKAWRRRLRALAMLYAPKVAK